MLGMRGDGRLVANPDRNGGCQPLVIRRQLKEYDLLIKPRRQMEAEIAAKQRETR
jgi:hypothetical protein